MRLVVPRLPVVRDYQRWLAAGYANEALAAAHEDDLRAVIRTCHELEVTVRVALMPLIQGPTGSLDQPAIHQRLAATLEGDGASVIDLWPKIAKRDLQALMVSRIDGHPNESAQQIFANAICRAFYSSATP